jgi:hypothetical protein
MAINKKKERQRGRGREKKGRRGEKDDIVTAGYLSFM